MSYSSDRSGKAHQWYASKRLAGVLLLGLLLLGCSRSDPAASSSTDGASHPSGSANNQTLVQTPTAGGQMLPLSAQLKIADQVIQLEVARTAEQQEMGLMYRTALAPDRGMAFPFDSPRRVGFWMKNTLIPLDLVFLLKAKVQSISSNVPPCKADPCPIYGSNALVDQVIELRAGRATELGLKQGDRVSVQSVSHQRQ